MRGMKIAILEIVCGLLVCLGTIFLILNFLDPETSIWHKLLFFALITLIYVPLRGCISSAFKALRESKRPISD